MRRGESFPARALAAVAVLLVLAAPLAAQTPTPEQLQMFQGLTPEQQNALLEQLGSGGATGKAAAAAASAAAKAAADKGSKDAKDPKDSRDSRNSKVADRSKRLDGNGEPKIPVLTARDSVLVEISARITLTAEEEARRKDIVARVLSRNPYALDRSAQLILPGFAPIALGGLTEEQATQRLVLEPTLADFIVKLTLLPVDKPGVKPYGYEFFNRKPYYNDDYDEYEYEDESWPAAEARVPADYVVGAGDEFNVQLYGNRNQNLRLPVNRDGAVNFPELGPIEVGGLAFSAARRLIESRVQKQLIGVSASVSMGDARAISVFVLGEAMQQGAYSVNGLATMTTALFAAGGVSDIGSLRDIQLKRQGQVIRHLDLYDLMNGGDTSNDAKLLPGDSIFIPPVGPTVSIDGEVKRPAIYELRGENSVADLARIALGLTPQADGARVSLTSINATGLAVLNLNLNDAAGRAQVLRNGDALFVAALRPQLDVGVTLDGFVHRPGLFAWRQGMRLSDVIDSVEELKSGADQNYVLIRRESGPERRVTLFSVSLIAALAARGSAADPQLATRDRIHVFELGPGRDRIIKPWLEELRLQSDISHPTEIVTVRGGVKAQGEYPLEPGMRVADLLRAGGNLEPSAYIGPADLTRSSTNAAGIRETRLITIDLAAVRRGDAAANLELQPYDSLLVRDTPEWGEQQTIVLRGEVRIPGVYPISRGETLREVLQRAGGLTDQAFPEGSAFTRIYLKELEQKQLDKLSDDARGEVVALSMQSARAGQANAGEALLTGQSLLAQLQAAKATGRFVIDLPGLLAAGARSEKDILLRNGDELYIPRLRQEVTVIGEIQNSTSHLYQRKLARADYIKKSGGTTRKADRRHVYVVRADGSVATNRDIKAGDTIVVPVDNERMPRLPFWQSVTQILYNLSLSVAAVNSF